MDIRRAEAKDLNGIRKLLFQVNQLHADGRPDLFKSGGIKYTDREILEIIADDRRPVYVFAPEDQVLGYVFCVLEETAETSSLRPMRTLYIDDLCVDETARGQHIGQRLYDRAVQLARDSGCARVTLHAWNFNEKAFGFYEKLGMKKADDVMQYNHIEWTEWTVE